MKSEVLTTTSLSEQRLKKLKQSALDDEDSRSTIQFLHKLIDTDHNRRFPKK